MARVDRRGFRGGFFGFGKKPKPVREEQKPVNGAEKHVVSKPKAHSEAARFALKQLSFQSKYFPELTAIHNRYLKEPEFYPDARGKASSVLVITGKKSIDSQLALNLHRMLSLEKKINDLRNSARKIKSLEHAKEVVDNAGVLETTFNDLKRENYLIFLEAFKKKKKR